VLEFFNLINFLIIIGLLLLIFIKNDLFSYLIIIEFVWLLLYTLLITIGLSYDSVYLICLNPLVLILAGLEFSIGLFIYYVF